MRSDMHHCLVERERKGGNKYSWRTLRSRIDHEFGEEMNPPSGMRKIHKAVTREYKELNENLNPLYRFLNSCAGRKWDEVHSEMCEHIRLDSAVQRHVLEHVDHFVEKDVIIINGEPYHSSRRWKLTSYRSRGPTEMYVDPRDGILKFQPRGVRYRFKHEPSVAMREIDTKTYCQKNGVWYEVTFDAIDPHKGAYVPLTEEEKKKEVKRPLAWLFGPHNTRWQPHCFYDVLYKDHVDNFILYARYGKDACPSSKMQLNKHEIRRLKLNQSNKQQQPRKVA